jgi:5-methylcytosine-specific restriction endonuclease McrA
VNYEIFKKEYLIENLTNGWGFPKHTRFVKQYFYRFRDKLKEEFGFDILTCSVCGIKEWNNLPIIMELDHLNRITNDSRIENLSPKCPNCHQQTFGYKNRRIGIKEYFQKLIK